MDNFKKLVRMQSSCKHCLKTGHTAFYCPSRPRTTLQPKSPMRKAGKHFDLWAETRKRWLEENEAPEYLCYICNKTLTREELTLDHIESRSRRPELRYEIKNLRPCCAKCNRDKGSLALEEYLAKRKEQPSTGGDHEHSI